MATTKREHIGITQINAFISGEDMRLEGNLLVSYDSLKTYIWLSLVVETGKTYPA